MTTGAQMEPDRETEATADQVVAFAVLAGAFGAAVVLVLVFAGLTLEWYLVLTVLIAAMGITVYVVEEFARSRV